MNNINKEDKKWLKKQCKDGVEYLDGLARDNLENGYTTNNINKVLEPIREFLKTLDTPKDIEDTILDMVKVALQDRDKELIKMVENTIEEYFKGLIVIPFPELTKKKLKETIVKRLKE